MKMTQLSGSMGYKLQGTKYQNNEIVETWEQSNIKATMEHWDGWRRLDNSMGATAKIYAKINAKGEMKVYKYVTRLGNQKVVYMIEED
jgi:hypothetical protein